MKAFIINEPYKTQWREIEKPNEPSESEVQIQIKAAGICGTDLHIYEGKHGAVVYPRIPGHELVGEVVQVGSKVVGIKIGDRIAVDPVVSCGECSMCQTGRHNICHQVKCLGVQTEGGFTELININADRVFLFSSSLDWEVAALVEPFSIAAQITERLRVTALDKVVIVGGGTIGLALLQVIQRVYGAEVVVADISDYKLSMAKDMGAKGVINAKEIGNLVAKAKEIWSSSGPTVLIDAVGNSKILNDLINCALPGCRIGVIGFMAKPISISPVEITKRELEIIGSRMNNKKFPDVLRWFAEGKLDSSSFITHKYAFHDAQMAFEDVTKNPDKVCKAILEF